MEGRQSTHSVEMVDAPVVPPTIISIRRSTIISMSSTMSTSTSSIWTTETSEFEMEGRMGITEAAAQLAKAKAVKTAGSSIRETRPWRVRDMVVEGRSKEGTKKGKMPPGSGGTLERVWPCLLYLGGQTPRAWFEETVCRTRAAKHDDAGLPSCCLRLAWTSDLFPAAGYAELWSSQPVSSARTLKA